MEKTKFDIYKFLKARPLSYSAYNLFCDPKWGSPEKWYDSYILGKRQESPELTFGSWVDKKIQEDPTFLPSLPRYENMQWKGNITLGKNIAIVGLADGLNLIKEKCIADFKTGKALWNKARADETKQLTWYIMLAFVILKIPPEEFTCRIHWLPTVKTEKGDFTSKIEFVDNIDENIQTFETKRTMMDVLNLMKDIKKVVVQMEDYVNSRQT